MIETRREKEDMNLVFVGHVDHGKSTIIGRMLADTGSLPDGKLEQVKENCKRNAKPFEYAFLLDALKDEQSQGITIDAARCFFQTPKRNYIIIDAPGHIEFLKNMVTGASRAEAALLVIDANEGVQENSKRHGYMLAMLGIKQVAVLVNKMDLVEYSEQTFRSIVDEYQAFLKQINIDPRIFIPVSGMMGDNVANLSKKMPWYSGKTVLEQLDAFDVEKVPENLPFRMSVQDVYKFTKDGDKRCIIAGTMVMLRNYKWIKSSISKERRAEKYSQKASLVLITGERGSGRKDIAKHLEQRLFEDGKYVYYLGLGSILYGVDADIKEEGKETNRKEHLRRMAEVAHIMMDSGVILIVTAVGLTEDDLETVKTIISGDLIETVWVGESLSTDLLPDIHITESADTLEAASLIKSRLQDKGVIFRPY